MIWCLRLLGPHLLIFSQIYQSVLTSVPLHWWFLLPGALFPDTPRPRLTYFVSLFKCNICTMSPAPTSFKISTFPPLIPHLSLSSASFFPTALSPILLPYLAHSLAPQLLKDQDFSCRVHCCVPRV